MALTQSTLASGLESLTPTSSEPVAISAFVDAFETYWNGATVSGAGLNPGTIDTGLAAMQGAMAGLSVTGQGATKIAAGVSAFWSAQAALATTMWTTAPIVLVPPIVPPAGLSGLAAALSSTFASNLAGELSLTDAAAALAATIHAANLGGVVPGSAPPAAPAPIPIL